MSTILYLSLTGMSEALGKSQVIAYLKPLATTNHIFLISFEREQSAKQQEELRKELQSHNITWVPLRYSNKFGVFSTLAQIFTCIFKGLKITWKHKVSLIHARSMIPAIMGYMISVFSSAKLLFDIRDFSTDEKVDRGRIKKDSLIYRLLLSIENFLYKASHKIVALTHVSKDILIQKFNIVPDSIVVIPTCADADVFFPIPQEKKQTLRAQFNFHPDDFICIHVGTVTGWYLFDQELEFFKKLYENKKNAKLLILNQGQHQYIETKLAQHNIESKCVSVCNVEYEEVNNYINIADVALYFIVPSYSKKAAAPTKFAEFVRVNLPSITNAGVGDMDYYINKYKTGAIVDPYNITPESIEDAIATINQSTLEGYSTLYSKSFSIEYATKQYQLIYDELTNE